jgi:hypothetical protein
MRVDVDFESYAAARWHLVVRSLVLLGVPPGHAATLTRHALVRRHAEWSHQDAFDDLDAELYRTALELKRGDDAAWWVEPAFDDELWVEIEPELDRLDTVQREWLVLRHVAELPESHISAAVGESDPGARAGVPTGERLREVARLIPVPPLDLEQVVAVAAAGRRRRRRRTLVVTAAVAGLAGVAGLVFVIVAVTAGDDESPGGDLDRVPVQRAESLSDVGWYSEGRLHLKEVILDLPDLQTVAVINDGAIYTDGDGRLVQVNDQGERTLLATIGLGGSYAVSDEEGVVAWVPEGGDELVVREVTARSELVRVAVSGPAEVIAVDSGSVYFRDDRGDQELLLAVGGVEPMGTGNLADVVARVRAFQDTSRSVSVLQSVANIEYSWPGQDPQLSVGGRFVLMWTPRGLAIYDTRTGDPLVPDVEPSELAIAAEFGPSNTINYLVLQPPATHGVVLVRSCSLGRVFLSSGEAAPECTEEVAGSVRAEESDLRLAR